MIFLIQHFEADFPWKVSLKILNSGIILKTFTHVLYTEWEIKRRIRPESDDGSLYYNEITA